ncbi:unnamed protein product, partial [Cyprideis torosa]
MESVQAQLNMHKDIRAIYLETPSNPKTQCLNIAQVSQVAKAYNVPVIVDNTFATPYLQRPLTMGADMVIHSTTKFLNGHGNALGGVVITGDKKLQDILWEQIKLTGATSNAWEAWLLHNGLKTLPLRMDKHCQNAMQLAEFFEAHPMVDK